MSKQREAQFKEVVFRHLSKLPKIWFKKIQAGSVGGIPDILGIVNGFPFAWELKRSLKEKPKPLQVYELRRIRKAGGVARIVHPENFSECLDELKALSIR